MKKILANIFDEKAMIFGTIFLLGGSFLWDSVIWAWDGFRFFYPRTMVFFYPIWIFLFAGCYFVEWRKLKRAKK